MEKDRLSRKLAVILHADVVGSTSLVQQNEIIAHERILEAFQDLSKTVINYKGSTRELRGDALLAEFERASDAVAAAIAFQSSNEEKNAAIRDDIKPQLRIGISIGEVVVADETITGSGVVLAQRIEQLSNPGGVCITAALHEALPKHMPFHLESLGKRSLKGFDDEVQVYKVSLSSGRSIPLPEKTLVGLPSPGKQYLTLAAVAVLIASVFAIAWLQSLPTQPKAANGKVSSIAVLPFENMSGESSQDYFSYGIAEDIIADLSRLKRLSVIASNSSFSPVGASATIQDIGRDLGVQYLLNGSVQRSGDQLRVNAKLIETKNGEHLWANKFDGKLTDLFSFQDKITQSVVSALSIQLTGEEQEQIARGMPSSFEAYDLFLHGQESRADYSEEGLSRAMEMFRQAISVDPDFGRAYGALAVATMRKVFAGYSRTPAESKERALELAQNAVRLDPNSPQTHWALGYVYMYRNQFDEAVEALEKAIELSPSYADAYALLALVRNNQGLAEDALRLLEKGIILNPHYSWDYLYNFGRAHYVLGQYRQASEYLEQALARNESPSYPRLFLIASYVGQNRTDEAEWEVEQLGMFHPEMTLTHIRKTLPIVNAELMERFLENLRTAGLEE